MSLFVRDLESGTIADFLVSGVSKVKIRLSYLISTYIIGVLMQLMVFIVIFSYFASVDQITLSSAQIGHTVGLILFTSVLWVILNALLTLPVKNSDTLGRIGSIIGTRGWILYDCLYSSRDFESWCPEYYWSYTGALCVDIV